jgi:tetratricopeptide (TPR) repeat protein
MNKIDWLGKLGWTEDHLEELRNAGYSYIRQGKYEMARPFFEALCVLNPEGSYDLQTLGAIYMQLGQSDQAIKYLDRALQIEGDHSPTLMNLAKAFFMSGKIAEGLKLAAILKKDPNPFISSTAAALILAYEKN